MPAMSLEYLTERLELAEQLLAGRETMLAHTGFAEQYGEL